MKHLVVAHAKLPGGDIRKWYWAGDQDRLASTNILKAATFSDPDQAKEVVEEKMFQQMIGKLIIRVAPHIQTMTDEQYFLEVLKHSK